MAPVALDVESEGAVPADHITVFQALAHTKCPTCGRSVSRVPPQTVTEVRLAPQIDLCRPGSDIKTCKRCGALVETLSRAVAA